MIALLEGTVAARSVHGVVLMTAGGVGYQVFTSLNTLAQLPEVGLPARVHIHTHVREDAILLYGFVSEAERAAFLDLLRVSKIGPKLALNILSGLTAEDVVRAVQTGDVRRLSQIVGIGKKTAERIVVELRESMRNVQAAALGDAAPPATKPADRFDDLLSALGNMGFKPAAVDRVVRQLQKEAPDAALETLIKLALARIR